MGLTPPIDLYYREAHLQCNTQDSLGYLVMFFASSLHLHKDGTTLKNKIESDPNKPKISLHMYMCLFIEPWCTIDSLFSPH